MGWFGNLITGHSVSHAILVISAASVLGLAIGHIKFGAIRFGVAGVIFSSILLSHFGMTVDHEILEFCRELGLMLFVYLTGLQVGPGFFSSFKKFGIRLNSLAVLIVITGTVMALLIGKFLLPADKLPVAVGLLSGATTNTPSLGAAHQTLVEKGMGQLTSMVSVGYAIAYPFGVLGIIIMLLFFRHLFKIDLGAELEKFNNSWFSKKDVLQQRHLKVTNRNLVGKTLDQALHYTTPRVVVSRIFRQGRVSMADYEKKIELEDVLLAVGSVEGLDSFQALVGEVEKIDLTSISSHIDSRKCLVTKTSVIGKTLEEVDLWGSYDVSVTRIMRAGVELVPGENMSLQFGDELRLVGEPEYLKLAANELGDSRHALDSPRLVPMFFGLAVGILLGSVPLQLPGVPVPVKLGLAGGPLLAAITLSRIGRIGPMIWHMPENANRALREFGIVLFLVCVGLKAGEGFFDTILHGDGGLYLLYGASITLLPLLLVGLAARLIYKQNYLAICGLLSGSMTDPPALAFATSLTGSQGAAVAYATVYPLAMICRIISTQILVLLFL